MGIKAVATNEALENAAETAESSQERVSCVPAPVKTALYRHFDGEGKLLYVGISLSPIYRLSQHQEAAHWAERIVNVSVEWHPDRHSALAAERAAVAAEKPECNIMLQAKPEKLRIIELAQESRADLNRLTARFKPAYTMSEASAATSIGGTALRLAMWFGELSYFVTGAHGVSITGWALIEFLEALESGSVVLRKPALLPDGSRDRPPNMEQLVFRKQAPDLEEQMAKALSRY